MAAGAGSAAGKSKVTRTPPPSSYTGCEIAKRNDLALVPGMLERGIDWLKDFQNRQVQLLKNAQTKPKPTDPYKEHADDTDALVYMVLVDAGADNESMRDFLYRDRTKLSVYSKAMFGLALEKTGRKDELDMILKNLQQYVVEDEENQTAYLKLPADNCWWFWYGSETEANAYYLETAGEDRSQRPIGVAAGEVFDQQSPARNLLEQHPRHCSGNRSPGRLLESQRRE